MTLFDFLNWRKKMVKNVFPFYSIIYSSFAILLSLPWFKASCLQLKCFTLHSFIECVLSHRPPSREAVPCPPRDTDHNYSDRGRPSGARSVDTGSCAAERGRWWRGPRAHIGRGHTGHHTPHISAHSVQTRGHLALLCLMSSSAWTS